MSRVSSRGRGVTTPKGRRHAREDGFQDNTQMLTTAKCGCWACIHGCHGEKQFTQETACLWSDIQAAGTRKAKLHEHVFCTVFLESAK